MINAIWAALQRWRGKRPHRTFPAPLPFEQRAEVIELWDEAWTYADNATETGVSRRSVARIIKAEKDRREMRRQRRIVAELNEATQRLLKTVQDMEQQRRR